MRNAFSFFVQMRERYGDLVSIPTLQGPFYVVFHPDDVRHILQENHSNYNKDMIANQILRLLLGNGLLTNNGDAWLRQRRLIQPAFHRERVSALGALMTDVTLAWVRKWEMDRFVDTNKPLDLTQEMSELTLSIVGQALFGTDLSKEIMRVSRALTVANQRLSEALSLSWLLLLPTPQRRRLSVARDELHLVVEEIIRQRRHPGEHKDLLALLLEAHDEETGEGMTDEQARDEVLTLLLAGHETTANVLSWTFLLLAQHPAVEARLRQEYQQALNGHPPRIADLPQLPTNRMVIEEAMRLYPPAWILGRRALSDDEIRGHILPKGAPVLLLPYVTHRHPSFWERPDKFDPERFSSARSAGRPRFAYFPFGGGPRLCIGNQFALFEAQLILATVLSRYQIRLSPGATIRPSPLVTLRPHGDLVNILEKAPRIVGQTETASSGNEEPG